MKQRDADQEKFRNKQEREKSYQKQLPGEDEQPLPSPVEPVHAEKHPGRNEPCPCGSGKKYKQCCGKAK